MKCKYDCGREANHEHLLIMLNDEILPDDKYDLKSEPPYMWSGSLLPVYSIIYQDKNVGKVFNGDIEINEEGQKLGLKTYNYKFELTNS